jgi:hypothetical protein
MSLMDVCRATSLTLGHLSRFERGEDEMRIAKMRELVELYTDRLRRGRQPVTIDELIADAPQEAPVG